MFFIAALCNRAGRYIFVLWFLLFSFIIFFFPCLFSAITDWMSTILVSDISLLVWGTAANFNRFRVLASLLQRCHSTEANRSLHDVWPSPGLIHCIYRFLGALAPREFCKIHFASKSCTLLYWQHYCMALGWLLNKKAARVEVNISLAFLHWVGITFHP